MPSHFLLMVVFAACVSAVLAVLMREEPREQMRLGGRFLGAFIASALLLGWLMYPFPL